jgi:hypothetical protein
MIGYRYNNNFSAPALEACELRKTTLIFFVFFDKRQETSAEIVPQKALCMYVPAPGHRH